MLTRVDSGIFNKSIHFIAETIVFELISVELATFSPSQIDVYRLAAFGGQPHSHLASSYFHKEKIDTPHGSSANIIVSLHIWLAMVSLHAIIHVINTCQRLHHE